MRDIYYNVDAVTGVNLSGLKTAGYGTGATGSINTGVSAGTTAAGGNMWSKGSGVPYAAIGEAVGLIISTVATASAQQKLARLQEATGMAELRWADENERFYRKLATESQRRDYMVKVVVSQIRERRESEGGEKDRKFRNVVLISLSLIALGVALPLMIKYYK
jgi:hypothetical protein